MDSKLRIRDLILLAALWVGSPLQVSSLDASPQSANFQVLQGAIGSGGQQKSNTYVLTGISQGLGNSEVMTSENFGFRPGTRAAGVEPIIFSDRFSTK